MAYLLLGRDLSTAGRTLDNAGVLVSRDQPHDTSDGIKL